MPDSSRDPIPGPSPDKGEDPSAQQTNDDLGLSRRFESTQRMMQKDGRMTVKRLGEASHFYHDLLEMSWMRFLMMVILAYIGLNTLFALVYLAVGLEQLANAPTGGLWYRFGIAFHFSAQTLTTVGYGFFSPQGPIASSIATLEALVGLLSFALATGLVYGRFANPTPGIVFSPKAILGPYGDGKWGLQVALANGRASELLEIEARMLVTFSDFAGDDRKRVYHELKLERDNIYFLSMNWNLVHEIKEGSPLHGINANDLALRDVEVLVLVKAFNEDFSQWVHARTSYTAKEIFWNGRFVIPYEIREDGETVFDLDRLGQIEAL